LVFKVQWKLSTPLRSPYTPGIRRVPVPDVAWVSDTDPYNYIELYNFSNYYGCRRVSVCCCVCVRAS
jgi:hypothetical protein